MVKNMPANAGDLGWIPRSGKSLGEQNNYPRQYSCLKNSWTEDPGRLQSMGLERVRHDWVIELNWTDPIASLKFKKSSHFYKRCMNVPFPHIPVLSGWCSIKTVPVWWIKVILCYSVIFIFLLLSDLTIFFFVWGPPRLALPSSHSLCPFFCWTVSILTVCKCVWCVFLLTLFLYYFCN